MRLIELTQRIELQMTVSNAERLKELGLLDVFGLTQNPESFSRLLTDPPTFVSTLWEITDQRGLTREGFDTLARNADHEQLWNAFVGELTDFFHDPMERQIVAAIIGAAEESWQRMLHQMLMAVSDSNQNADGEQYGNSPESSESILDLSHSDNSMTWQPGDSALNGVVVVA